MIDWLTSKLGVLIAIAVTTGFVLSIFAWQHSILVDREGQAVADSIARTIDQLGSLEASTKLNMTFGNSPEQLPLSINGQGYSINITTGFVFITQGERRWSSEFISEAICQNLTERQFNLTTYGQLETASYTGEMSYENEIFMERASIDVSGEIKYITLIYFN